MARQPSADPFGLVLGRGTTGEREYVLENIEPRDKQIWIVTEDKEVVDIHQYDSETDKWNSLLGAFLKSVSGMSPDSEGNVDQVVTVDSPSPDTTGAREKQIGIDPVAENIYWFINGEWVLLAGSDSTTGATETHHIDPDENQVGDPTSTPDLTEVDGGGSLSAGTYKYAITYTCPWGETLKSPTTASITVDAGDAIDLTNVPVASEDINGIERNVYRTEVDGDTLYYLATIGNNTDTIITDDGSFSLNTSAGVPSSNTTNAHRGNLTEDDVAYDAEAGHNHDGANSRTVFVPEHALDGPKHTGDLPWGSLVNVPDTFPSDDHPVDPTDANSPHTGDFPWSELKGVPDLAGYPHGNDAHSNDYASDNHDNTAHSQSYITGATERIRYGAGQLGGITAMTNLQAPEIVDVEMEAVKLYAVARVAPTGNNISSTVTVKDSSGSTYFETTITLTTGDNMETLSISQTLQADSMIHFSLNDSDSGNGQDFGVYLIAETDIGS